MALIKAKPEVEVVVMAVDVAKGCQVPSVIPVVPSQEDLAETVEPNTHQNSVLPTSNPVTIVTWKVISPSFVTKELAPSLNSARRGNMHESEQYTEFEPFEFEHDTITFGKNLKGSLSKSNILFDEMDNELARVLTDL